MPHFRPDDYDDFDRYVHRAGHPEWEGRHEGRSFWRHRYPDTYHQREYFVPVREETTVRRTRAYSHDRPPDRPSLPVQNPVIINSPYYEQREDDRPIVQLVDARRSSSSKSRSRSHSHSHSRSHSHSHARSSPLHHHMTHADWEAKQALLEREQERLIRETQDNADLRQAKRELDEINRQKVKAAEEKRIRDQVDHQRLKDEEAAAEAKKRQDKADADAVAAWQKKEADRIAREAKEKAEKEKELKLHVREEFRKAGMSEQEIDDHFDKDKKKPETAVQHERAVHTRIPRKYLSIQTLRVYDLDYELDANPDYLIVKRWVPPEERWELWQHTQRLRQTRKVLMIEEKKKHGHEPKLQWTRKKSRSISPAILAYIAGGRPGPR